MIEAINLENLRPTYMSPKEVEGSEVYLQNLSFTRGNSYLIKGESGRGKSSLFNFLYRASTSYQGSISIQPSSDRTSLYREGISCVFQDFKLFDDLSVLENLELNNQLTNHKSSGEILSMISHVGLSEKTHALLATLSRGQKQRVAILRSLCQPFSFLLMDEPFSHLDEENIIHSYKLIKQEIKKNQAAFIVFTLGSDYGISFDHRLTL